MQIPLNRNPKTTLSLNPKVTLSLNPKVTLSLNPKATLSLNPKATLSLNPKATLRLNPKATLSLNPKATLSLNPKATLRLNPKVTHNIEDLYIWSLEFKLLAFTVKANEKVRLIFDEKANFIGILVVVKNNFMNEFDINNDWIGLDWIGYWVQARDKVWLRYSVDGKWIGSTS